MTIDMFGTPRPKYFTMGTEMYGDRIFASLDTGLKPGQGRSYQNGNAGVMLLNTRNMRRVHDECVWSAHKIVVVAVFTAARNRSMSCLFLSCVLLSRFVAWTFSETNVGVAGLHFGRFGPGDQGALNMFFHDYFDVRTWPLFNWKPYWGDKMTYGKVGLVHFHGPKPHEYIRFHTNKPADLNTKDDANTTNAIQWLLKQCETHGSHCWRFTQLFLTYREQLASGDESYQPQQRAPQTPTVEASEEADCTDDIPPDGTHSCRQQALWGKCSQSWMKGFCCMSCRLAALYSAPRAARRPSRPAPQKPKDLGQTSSDYFSDRDALLGALRAIDNAWKRIEPDQKHRCHSSGCGQLSSNNEQQRAPPPVQTKKWRKRRHKRPHSSKKKE
jgi:hypothetical protein